MRIFQIDNVVTDIIGSFYQPYKWMPLINNWTWTFLNDLSFFCDFEEFFLLRLEKSKFFAMKNSFFTRNGFAGIFRNRSQSCKSQTDASFEFPILFLGQNSNCIGISFEMNKIRPFFFRKSRL